MDCLLFESAGVIPRGIMNGGRGLVTSYDPFDYGSMTSYIGLGPSCLDLKNDENL